MLTLKKLSVEYNTQTILDEVTISFNQNEASALVGENGAGKSTLLKVCAGVEQSVHSCLPLTVKALPAVSRAATAACS